MEYLTDVLIFSLDVESSTSLTVPIIAAILPLRQDLLLRSQVDGLISRYVCYKKEETKEQHLKLYFLVDQCSDPEVVNAIKASIASATENSWLEYFNMLVKEINRSNSLIRYQAVRKLAEVMKHSSSNIEKYILAKGYLGTSYVISALLTGLCGAVGGKPEDEKTRVEIANCFGNLGALNPSQFLNVHEDIKSQHKSRLAVASQIKTFCLFYLEELIREFNNAKDATNFDYCVCLIKNLFLDFDVQMTGTDYIWSRLTKENQELIKPMLETKYFMGVEEKLPNFERPIYLSDHGKTFDDWLLNWLTVLITYIQPPIDPSNSNAYALFSKNKFLLRKNARIAAFILPHVASKSRLFNFILI